MERREFFEKIKRNYAVNYSKRYSSLCNPTTTTDIYYILKKSKGHKSTIEFLGNLFGFVDIAKVSSEIFMNALQSELTDFEDAVQVEIAKQNGIGIVITRNKADFVISDVTVFTPDEFFQHYQSLK